MDATVVHLTIIGNMELPSLILLLSLIFPVIDRALKYSSIRVPEWRSGIVQGKTSGRRAQLANLRYGLTKYMVTGDARRDVRLALK